MKAIRIAALSAALLLVVAVTADAQGGAPAQQGRGRNQILNDMVLTDAQKVKVGEIQKKYQPELLAVRDAMQAGGDRADGMKKMIAISDRMYPEIRAVLTPDQQSVFDKNLAEMKSRMEQAQKQAPQR